MNNTVVGQKLPPVFLMKKHRVYPRYQNSSIPWLGEVPDHREVQRSKYIFQCIDERSKTGKVELLTVSSTNGVVPRKSTSVTMFKAESYVGHKLCWPDDLVINSLWAWGRGLGFARHHGIVSTAYGVYRVRSRNQAEPRYLDALVRSLPFHWELRVQSKGIWISRLQLTDESFLNSKIPLPPILEQNAIVRYLNYVDRRIRRYIGAKRKLIELLEEQKQVIIHRAVTRGLDPDVPLKDPGVEWLGDVPAHWEVMPLKYWLGINDIVLPEHTDADFQFDYLDIGSVGTGILVERPQKIRFGTAPSRARRVVRSGDTIVSTVRTYLKAVWYVKDADRNLIVSTGVAVLTPRQNTLPKFVSYLVQSNSFTNRVTAESVGITYPAIAEGGIGVFKVSIPPLSEQTTIVEYLDKATANIDVTISRARREIELLDEYRTRLTADVVTGKVDVREAAANLPDDPYEADESANNENSLSDGIRSRSR